MDAAERQLQLTADWYQQPRPPAFRFSCVSGSQTEHPETLNHFSTAVTACTACFNLLKPGGYFMYHQVQHSKILHPVQEVVSKYRVDLRTNSECLSVQRWSTDVWKEMEQTASNTSTSVHKLSIYVASTQFKTSALKMGVGVSTTHRPLYSRERPGTHCTGGWVGPRVGLDGCGKSRPHTGIRYPDRPARSKSLYRLSCVCVCVCVCVCIYIYIYIYFLNAAWI